MDELDFKIVDACNELIALKADAAKIRVDNTNERAELKRALEQKQREVDNRFRSMRMTKDLSVYRDSCAEVFDEAGIRVPGLAAARQAQLCLHIHLMTMMDNQLELAMLQTEKEQAALEIELHRVKESITTREVELLNQLAKQERENQEFREWMEEPFQKKKNNKNTQQQHTPSRDVSTSLAEDDLDKEPRISRTRSLDTAETETSSPPSSPESVTREVLAHEQSAPAMGQQHHEFVNVPQLKPSSPRAGSKMVVPARPQHLMATRT